VQTYTKRQKEQARAEKKRKKAEKKVVRQQEKDERPPAEPGVDPDIAHIIPGVPPPPLWD
jgi:hypothetical protein